MGCIISCFRVEVVDEHVAQNDSVTHSHRNPIAETQIILPLMSSSITWRLSQSLSQSASDNSLSDMHQFPSEPVAYDAEAQDSSWQNKLVSKCWKHSSHSNQESLGSNIAANSESMSYGGEFNMSAGDGETTQKLCNSSLGLSWVYGLTRYEELSQSSEEDFCPTCLEEYTSENPKMTTKCSHNFHLGCIYEWLERSETCPMCNKVMEFDGTS